MVKPNTSEEVKPLSLLVHQELGEEVPKEAITMAPLPFNQS